MRKIVTFEVTKANLIGGARDELGVLRIESELNVNLSSGFFEVSKSLDQGFGHALSRAANFEVLEAALGLSALRKPQEANVKCTYSFDNHMVRV